MIDVFVFRDSVHFVPFLGGLFMSPTVTSLIGMATPPKRDMVGWTLHAKNAMHYVESPQPNVFKPGAPSTAAVSLRFYRDSKVALKTWTVSTNSLHSLRKIVSIECEINPRGSSAGVFWIRILRKSVKGDLSVSSINLWRLENTGLRQVVGFWIWTVAQRREIWFVNRNKQMYSIRAPDEWN